MLGAGDYKGGRWVRDRRDKGLVLGLRCSLAVDDVLSRARCALSMVGYCLHILTALNIAFVANLSLKTQSKMAESISLTNLRMTHYSEAQSHC